MKQEPKFIAFSTQKGGAGKTTFTVLTASYLHYVCGYNVMVVDCDFPQYSINQMRTRDAALLDTNLPLHELAVAQFSKIQKSTYPILCSTPEEAIATVNDHLAQCEEPIDYVFFDLPGTFNSEGVIHTLSNVDYIFTPVAADKISLESTVSFASVVKEHIVDNPESGTKGIYLFWNMVDGREKTNLYSVYEAVIRKMGVPILQTFIPNTTRYKKEGADEGVNLFRSTIFPASRPMLRGSRLVEFVNEVLETVTQKPNGQRL